MLQKTNASGQELTKKKEQLIKQGYLVVTIIEGTESIEKGLQEVVKNHFH